MIDSGFLGMGLVPLKKVKENSKKKNTVSWIGKKKQSRHCSVARCRSVRVAPSPKVHDASVLLRTSP